jgi:uncharacterized protein (DUF302 family)
MQLTAQKYGYSKTVNYSFNDALERTKKALQEQGFGVQAEINLSSALRDKLRIEVAQQIILGACNPQLAHKALQAESEIGLLLPCNVTVRQDGQQVKVAVIDPERLMDFVGNPELRPIAEEAKRRLRAVLDRI